MSTKPPFEIGITMAGAISAGAYTAGVIDFLIEALDAWEAAKERNRQTPGAEPLCPQHDVSLRVMSGASAGSIVAAIVAANIDMQWDPVREANADDPKLRNPLFDSWVNQVDIHPLLGDNDLKTDPAPVSILDATSLDAIAAKALSFDGPRVSRSYVANPLRAIFALTNLTGVPFRYDLRGNTGYGQDMTMHADLMRFGVMNAGKAPAPPIRLTPDASYEYPLQPVPPAKWADPAWQRFALTSLASGAFPLGLRPRPVDRNKSDYSNIPLPMADDSGSPVAISPSWAVQPNEKYSFLSVDGGCVDNEPLQLARIELSGSALQGNERGGMKATKAVVMIDPFVGPNDPGPSSAAQDPLHLAIFKLLEAYTQQSRFSSEDIELANREDVYSRFMIAPKRPTPPLKQPAYLEADGKWIASGTLGGFGGFLHREFRKHDFLLGRRNCQQFLAGHFTLPAGNDLFALWRDDPALRGCYVVPGKAGEPEQLPIIPLLGKLHPRHGTAEPVPRWPEGACDVDALGPPIEARVDALFKKYTSGGGFFAGVLLGLVWRFAGKPKILAKINEILVNALVSQGLMKPRPKESEEAPAFGGGA
jgi:hypothetical protein